MNNNSAPEPLGYYLRAYLNVDVPSISDLRRQIRQPKMPERAEAFRIQLADGIVNGSITPEQYEKLTDEDFDSAEDLNVWLRQLWKGVFDDEPIPGDQL